MLKLTYTERAKFCKNNLAKKILQTLDDKKTNLALSADVTSAAALLSLADTVGPEICILKTHIDIITDFKSSLIKKLKTLAKKHQFFIFEDRKFADIGHTVMQQYAGGLYRIAEWAHLVNAHALPGPGILQGLTHACGQDERGVLLLAQMSSSEHLLTSDYTEKTVSLAAQFPELVVGFIAQKKLTDHPHWLYMTPGVQLTEKSDSLGQQYITPDEAVRQNETDIIIVGRGIIKADDPVQAAKRYRTAGWQAYQSFFI